jgi:genome maintenance exonuclease 1
MNEIHAIETPLFSHDLRLAGTTDCVAEYDGILSIVDFKTALKPKRKEWVSSYFMQGVAYSHMFEEMTGKKIEQIIILIGVDNQNFCQTFRLSKAEYGTYMDSLILYRDKYEDKMKGTLWAT